MKLRRTLKRFLYVFLTLLLIVVLVNYLGHCLDPEWSEGGFEAIKAFHSLDSESLDVIVYGSSHAWKGFDTGVLVDDYGIKAYNYGCNWQAINTTLLFLQDSLAYQNPKVVCIEAFHANYVEQDTCLDGQIYYTRGLPFSKAKLKYVKQCFGNNIEGYMSYIFPLIMFHDNWSRISSENFSNDGYQRFIDSHGFKGNDNIYEGVIPDYREFEQEDLDEDAIEVLDAIVNECKSRGIEVIFYTCPWEGTFYYGKAMHEYARQNDCVYLDLFENLDETGIDGKTDLQDAEHLNISGAQKVARYMGKYITDHYSFE